MTTLQEIAQRAGVSKMTVSNVLNNRNKENWPSTASRAQEIRALAEQMGYRPNLAAKAVVTGKFGAIGILSPKSLPSAPHDGIAWGL